MTEAILLFAGMGAVIVAAGAALTHAADVIADRTGLGRVWIGAVLLAAATSLPELVTDVAAVRMGAPDLAAGDLFGSSMANMVILAIIGLLPPRGRVFREASPDHALTAMLAIMLNSAAAAAVLTQSSTTLLGVSPVSVVLVAAFAAGMRVVYVNGLPPEPAPPTALAAATPVVPHDGMSLRAAVTRFAVAAAVILVAAPLFARSAEQIAVLSGLGSTFVGTWLVGAATSLPEVVSTVAAFRLGAYDLAVGNLMGSNSFNMAIFLAMDLAHPGGSIFALVAPQHAISAFFATILMALGLAAIVFRGQRRYWMLEPGSALMLIVYALALWTLYHLAVPN
jgi:cation:H+ antiporter